jgi:hypothetical protein
MKAHSAGEVIRPEDIGGSSETIPPAKLAASAPKAQTVPELPYGKNIIEFVKDLWDRHDGGFVHTMWYADIVKYFPCIASHIFKQEAEIARLRWALQELVRTVYYDESSPDPSMAAIKAAAELLSPSSK